MTRKMGVTYCGLPEEENISPHSARVIFNYNIFHTPSPSVKESEGG